MFTFCLVSKLLDPNPWDRHLGSLSPQTDMLLAWYYPSESAYSYHSLILEIAFLFIKFGYKSKYVLIIVISSGFCVIIKWLTGKRSEIDYQLNQPSCQLIFLYQTDKKESGSRKKYNLCETSYHTCFRNLSVFQCYVNVNLDRQSQTYRLRIK